MKYAKSRMHSTTTIHPDPTQWKHQPNPIIIEKCFTVAEYPLIAKSFAPKDESINYADIQKFKELFIGYDEAVQNYLNESSPLFLRELINARVKKQDVMSDEFKQLIQFYYEAQCALTEFFVLVSRYQFQFRKTMLPLLQENTKKAFKPYLHDALKKKSWSKSAYSVENAELLGCVYELYLLVGSGLKVMWQYTFTKENLALRNDVEMFWLMGGYIFKAYDLHYKALMLNTEAMYKEECLQQDAFYMDILEQIDLLLTSATGGFTREVEEGGVTTVELEKMFKIHPAKSVEFKKLYEQGYPGMSELGGNAVIKLTSNLLNPRLLPDHICTYEISLYTNGRLMENLVPEFIIFGGIYNQARGCVVYPMVLDVPLHLDQDKLTNHIHDQFNEYTRTFLETLMLNFPYIYFFDQEYALENQLKVYMDALAYS